MAFNALVVPDEAQFGWLAQDGSGEGWLERKTRAAWIEPNDLHVDNARLELNRRVMEMKVVDDLVRLDENVRTEGVGMEDDGWSFSASSDVRQMMVGVGRRLLLWLLLWRRKVNS
uniref:Uncharacterized protein n=1 Tax=Cucumis sativus TaxID=3659 RepID=A0A0A0KPU4_CUCSA